MFVSFAFTLFSSGVRAAPRPRLILFARAIAFVERDGTLDRRTDPPYAIKVEESDGHYVMSGFGMERERVRPYLTSPFARTRTLMFVSDDAKSERRPTLVYDRAGYATLYTHRLKLGGLRLRAIAEVSRPFLRDSITSNTLRLPMRGQWRVRCDELLAREVRPPRPPRW